MAHLLLTGVGEDRPGIVQSLTRAIADQGGNLEESRMAVLGGEFAIIMLVSGEPAVIEALEDDKARIGERTGLSIQTRRTERREPGGEVLRYHVEALSMDHPGIVNAVTDFFSRRNINIESLSTETYAAAHSGTPMFALDMIVEVPAGEKIAELRQAFVAFCDELFIDASLEPA